MNLVPSAELVRFTASGTEASLLALRIARAATGRERVVETGRSLPRLARQVASAPTRRSTGRTRPGCPPRSARWSRWCPADARAWPRAAGGDVAAVILEPSGAAWGTVPLPAGLLAGNRAPDHGRRRGADLRRGGLRLPLVAGRGAGGGRGDTRPHRAREDPGRRDAGRGGDRPGGPHGAPVGATRRPAPGRPSRHAQRPPDVGRRRHRRAARMPVGGAAGSRGRAGRRPARRADVGPRARPACPAAPTARARPSTC